MKKLLVLFLSLNLIFVPTFAHASALPNWQVTEVIKQGASTTFNLFSRATAANDPRFSFPTAANDPVYSRVKVAATPSGVAQFWKVFGWTAAAALAANVLLEGIDWVLDSENHRVTYTLNNGFYFSNFADDPKFKTADLESTAEAIVRDSVESYNLQYPSQAPFTFRKYTSGIDSDSFDPEKDSKHKAGKRSFEILTDEGAVKARVFPDIYAYPDLEPKTLSYEDIAAQVISDANAGQAEAQADTSAAANPETWSSPDAYPYPNPSPEAEANAAPDPDLVGKSNPESDPDPEPEPEPNPEPQPETEAGLICEKTPIFCVAAQAVVTIKDKVSLLYADLKDFISGDPPELVEPEKQQQPPEELPTVTPITFSTASGCPANPVINFSLGRRAASVDIPIDLACYVLELIRPFVIAGGYLTGASIIFRGRET